MNYISLFSGIGAFEKALERLGIPYELVAYCEIDKYASKSYQAIHGVSEEKNLGDITKVDEKKLPKDIDLITYGFPCQDISISGKMRGLFNEDGTQTRSGLFFEALRIIEETKPRVAIAENVKNLTGKKFAEQFKLVLDSLEQAGYNNYWKVLNAKDFGVPQNRERVFIVSIRKDIDSGTFEFPEGFVLERRLEDMLDVEVDKKYYLDARQTGLVKMRNQNSLIYDKNMQGVEGVAREYNEIHPTIPARENKDPRVVNVSRLLEMKSKQQTTNTNSQTLRKETPKESFRLMDFDDTDYEKAAKVNSNNQLYRQAGNSIVVSVPKHIFAALLECGALTL